MPRRSRTPGVKLIARKRAAGVTWYGRWVDPVTGDPVDTNLTADGLTTERQRLDWARAQSDRLRDRRRGRALGRPDAGTTTPDDAVAAYLRDCEGRLRATSVYVYREALVAFAGWLAVHARGRVMQDLTPELLWRYRTDAVARAGAAEGRKRMASTINSHLARVRSALEWWRKAGFTPLLTRDTIADVCEGLPRQKPVVRPMRPAAVRRLLAAAVAHPDWRAAAFVALSLLTGCRLGELEELLWDRVDLDAPPGGEIRLEAEDVKTHRPRAIDLGVSSTAADLLRALRRAQPGPYVLGGEHALSRELTQKGWKRELQLAADDAHGLSALRWTWQHLRQTTGTYLTCAPGIFGAASAFRSAAQLGHRVEVAQNHYLGVIRGIPASAATLEAAMEAEEPFKAVVESVKRVAKA